MHATSASVKNNLTAAIALARAGWRIFPLAPGSKIPRAGSRGLLDATDDEAVIERWWTESPSSNIGLATEQLVVIDIDGRDNPWLAGEADKLESLRDAISQTTPRGKHLIFWMPSGKSWRNSAGKLAERVDVRAGGGYIVAAPSETPQGKYEWIGAGLPANAADLPEPPAWLCEELDRIASGSSSVPATASEPIPEGRRNATLTSIGGALRRIGLEESAIAAALTEVSRERCKPPVPESEILTIAANMARYEPDPGATIEAEGTLEDILGPRGKFEILTPAAMYAMPRPRWLIDRLLPADGISCIYGAPNVGKSFVVLDMIFAIARGVPWCGLETEPSAILYCGAEGSGMADRLRAYEIGHGVRLEEIPCAVRFLAAVPQLARKSGREITIGNETRILAKQINEMASDKPKIIVFDTLARCCVGINENAAEEMGVVVEAAARLRNMTGCAIVLVHHSGKNPEAMERGSTAIRGAADCMIKVSGSEGGCRVEVDKQRDARRLESPIDLGFRYVEVGQDHRGRPVEGLYLERSAPVDLSGILSAPREESLEEQIYQAMGATAGSTWRGTHAIAKLARCRPQKVPGALALLEELGKVERNDGKGQQRRWRVARREGEPGGQPAVQGGEESAA